MMTLSQLYRATRIALALVLLFTAACVGRPDRFYMLQPMVAPGPGQESTARLVIAVGPVRFPDYLSRPQIVTSTGPNQFRFSEFERWIDRLKDNFTRVLAENLSNLLATDRVVQFPYPRAIVPDYQILVEVTQFHVTSEGKSLLQTNWHLVQDEKTILLKKSNIALPADTQSYATMVSAQSEALAALSREIASALQAVAHRTTARSIRPARKLQGKACRCRSLPRPL